MSHCTMGDRRLAVAHSSLQPLGSSFRMSGNGAGDPLGSSTATTSVSGLLVVLPADRQADVAKVVVGERVAIEAGRAQPVEVREDRAAPARPTGSCDRRARPRVR